MDAEWTPVPRAAHAPAPSPASATSEWTQGGWSQVGPVSHPSQASRIAELEQMLEILERARRAAEAAARPKRYEGDPVALTTALHPDNLRSVRRAASRRASRVEATPGIRVVVFDGVAAS